MVNQYDRKLESMMKKYGISYISEEQLNDNIESIIVELLTRRCAGKTCALWGAGRNNTQSSHAAVIVNHYATFIQKMVCIIDNDESLEGKDFLGLPIILPKDMEKYQIDIVIIASKNSGDSIKKNLHEVLPDCEYIDIYEELRKRGIEVYNNFFDESGSYIRLFQLKEKYEKAMSDEDVAAMKQYLKEIISLYVSIRDFYFGEKNIKEYIDKKFEDYEKMEQFLNELHQMLEEIQQKNSCKTEDISIFYIDALRGKDVFDRKTKKVKMFPSYINNAKLFSNMYATGVTTYESVTSFITGEYPLDIEVYKDDFLRNVEEFSSVDALCREGYEVNFLISDCYKILKDTDRVHFYSHLYMTQKLWSLVTNLAVANTKLLQFMYIPYEMHMPLLCGYHTVKPEVKAFIDLGIVEFPPSMEVQYQDCLNYTNAQFEYYYDLMGESVTKLIFSDHSQVVYDKNNNHKTYNMYYSDAELTTHIPFFISRKGQPFQEVEEMYSLVDFNSILYDELKYGDSTRYKKDIVRYQYYPIHNKKIRCHAKEYGFEDYIDGMDIFVSEQMVYIKTGTGKEEAYDRNYLEDNRIEGEGREFQKKVQMSYQVYY